MPRVWAENCADELNNAQIPKDREEAYLRELLDEFFGVVKLDVGLELEGRHGDFGEREDRGCLSGRWTVVVVRKKGAYLCEGRMINVFCRLWLL